MRGLWKRLQKRRRLDRDLEDELRFHLEMKTRDLGDEGEARQSIGNLAALKETCRDVWAFNAIESWWKDLRYGARSLWKSRGVTAAAIGALALGIGADTAVFTIVNAALSASLEIGVEHPERLVVVTVTGQMRRDPFMTSFRDFLDLRNEVKSVENLAAYRFFPVNVSGRGGLPERYSCVQISANGFGVTTKQPILGRAFSPGDELPGAAPVALLSHSVWQDRYGKDSSLIGQTIRVDDVPTTIVGVMPPGMQFPEGADLWIPLVPTAQNARYMILFGRLMPGVTLAGARSEMAVLTASLAAKYPETFKGLTVGLLPFLEMYGVYASRPLFLTLFCAVGFVLLIACADVANLLLSRAATRSREISIRIAIGAGRARVIRQLLVESVLLSLTGGFFGWLIALGGLRWFDAATGKFPRPPWIDFSMRPRVFVYLAAISIAAGIVFGLAPALRLSQVDVNSAVKDGGHGAANAMRGRYLSNFLVAFEMALCVILLGGAGLMIRSSIALYGAPLGVNPSNVLTAEIILPEAKYPNARDQIEFHQRLKARLESLPGVEVAAVASTLPTYGWLNLSYEQEGAAQDEPTTVGGLIVARDYFRIMQTRPLRGQLFADDAAEAVVPEAVINEAFARGVWPGQEPIGKRLRLAGTGPYAASGEWLTITGVIPDIQQDRRGRTHVPLLYVPYAVSPRLQAYLIARTRVPPSTLAAAFRQEVQNLDQDLPLSDIRSLENRIAQSRLETGAVGALFTVFAAIALVLASVGLYAIIAHSVSQRTREIGVRMAMGGSSGDILRLVFSQGLRPLAWGLLAGIPAALVLTRVLRSMLIGVSPGDPITFAGAVAILVAAGALGCAVPARRAVRVDPVSALRCD
jgi:putative ABC transport system permease protein